MRNLAFALLEQALADAVSHDDDVRDSARAFLFGEKEAMSLLRAHWLRQAGLPLDAFRRLAHLSAHELRERLRKTHANHIAASLKASGERRVMKICGAQEGT